MKLNLKSVSKNEKADALCYACNDNAPVRKLVRHKTAFELELLHVIPYRNNQVGLFWG